MICEECGKEHDGSFQSGRFCSVKCKNVYVGKIIKNKPKTKCEICGREFGNNIKQHYKLHEREEKEKLEQLNKIHICENCSNEHNGSYGSGRFCSCKCARGFSSKTKRKEINEKIRNIVINKLLNGEKVGFCKINFNKEKGPFYCNNCKKLLRRKNKSGYCIKCLFKSEEYKLKLSKSCKGKCGGFRKNSGFGKSGWYKNYFCQSSYELAWVIYSLDKNIKFERNNDDFFKYKYKDKEYKYYPDFKINNNTYIEINGYINYQWIEKINQFQKEKNLIILYKKYLKEIIKYVEEKYSKNFIELYEGNPHNLKKNKCKICGNNCRNEYCSQSCSGKTACLRIYKNNKKFNF